MTEKIIIHSFGLNDRSGKVRGLAEDFHTPKEHTQDFKHSILLNKIPKGGFWVRDLFANLRNRVSAGRIEWDRIKFYIIPLAARPAAKGAHFFDTIQDTFLDEAL